MAKIQQQSRFNGLLKWFSRFAEEISYVLGRQDRPSHLLGRQVGIESASSYKSNSTSTMQSRLREVCHKSKRANKPKDSYHNGRSTPTLTAPRSADRSSWTSCFSVFSTAKKQSAQVYSRPSTPTNS